MEIRYVGHSSFLLKTKSARILTDPFDSTKTGLKFPPIEADIVTVSHQHNDHNTTAQVGGNPLIIDWPGEFEKKSIRINGYATYHDSTQGTERGENVIYKFLIEDMSVVHLGDLGHKLHDTVLEEIGSVDIVFVPVGGVYTIDAAEAVAVIKSLDPSLVIPMHYRHEGLNTEQFGTLAPVDEFLAKIGVTPGETANRVTVKKEDLSDELTVRVMQTG